MELETQNLLRTLIEQSKESTEAARAAASAASRAADQVGTIKSQIESNRLESVNEHKKTRARLDDFHEELEALKRRVDGSDPPPSKMDAMAVRPKDPKTDPRMQRPPSLVEIATGAATTAAGVDARQAEFEGKVLAELGKLHAESAGVVARLDKQDKAFGIDRSGLAALFGPRNRKRALEAVAFAAILWGAYERSRQADQAAHAPPPSAGQAAASHGSLTP